MQAERGRESIEPRERNVTERRKARGCDVAQSVEATDRNARRNTDVSSTLPYSNGVVCFFSQGQLSVQTLLRGSCRPRVQSHASTSARTIKIPNTDNHTILWTHKNTAHTGRNRYRHTCPNFPRGIHPHTHTHTHTKVHCKKHHPVIYTVNDRGAGWGWDEGVQGRGGGWGRMGRCVCGH